MVTSEAKERKEFFFSCLKIAILCNFILEIEYKIQITRRYNLAFSSCSFIVLGNPTANYPEHARWGKPHPTLKLSFRNILILP